MNIFLSFLLSYLLGAIPTAYIVGRILKGIDIRHHGSGNVGATNTFRVLGKGPGTFVLLFDIVKGLLAVAVIGELFNIDILILRILLGLTAIAGHNWTIFLRFKGGKGIATSLGVLFGLSITVPPFAPVLALTVLVWGMVFLIFGFVSLASIVATAVLPLLMIFTNQPLELIFMGVVCCVFVAVRHRANITRLLAGQESRVNLFRRSDKEK